MGSKESAPAAGARGAAKYTISSNRRVKPLPSTRRSMQAAREEGGGPDQAAKIRKKKKGKKGGRHLSKRMPGKKEAHAAHDWRPEGRGKRSTRSFARTCLPQKIRSPPAERSATYFGGPSPDSFGTPKQKGPSDALKRGGPASGAGTQVRSPGNRWEADGANRGRGSPGAEGRRCHPRQIAGKKEEPPILKDRGGGGEPESRRAEEEEEAGKDRGEALRTGGSGGANGTALGAGAANECWDSRGVVLGGNRRG